MVTCIVKFCCIDDQVVIVGTGNQDSQSWYHSQELNIMVDSAQLATEWVAALNHNQNTGIYGAVDKDGAWC
jgi:phosphatidylserine/phosphatidylglycerophosphate/cardiolipin synthase-like enzyme